jgi:hypothetical protein
MRDAKSAVRRAIYGMVTGLALVLAMAAVGASPADADMQNPYGLTESKPLQSDAKAGEVRLLAELQPDAFAGGLWKSTPRYHGVVWRKGGAAKEALLTAYADDASVYDALVSLGAVPGNNLTMAAWNDRKDPASKAPDVRVEGTPVEVLVWWKGLASPLPLSALLTDSAGRGIDMRFGGNKALIPEWHSGCIACLYSCPGGKVSNHAYTIRDYVKGTTQFSVNRSVVPEGTRPAVVILKKK